MTRPDRLGAPTGGPRPSGAEAVLAHLDEAYSLARWLVRNAADAEGVVEDAVSRALAEPRSFELAGVRTQVLQTVRHAAYARLAAEPAPISDAEARDDLPGAAETMRRAGQNAEALLARVQAAERLDTVLAELPLELRECLVLCELHRASYAEISAIAQIPVGAVQARLWRGRCMLVRLAAQLAEVED